MGLRVMIPGVLRGASGGVGRVAILVPDIIAIKGDNGERNHPKRPQVKIPKVLFQKSPARLT